jgi:LysM repeat protein
MRRFLACLSLLLTATACGQKAEPPATLAQPVPFQTVTPTQTPTVLPPGQAKIILPTPTMISYTVVKGDTLSSIAQRYGVSLEALLAANSGVLPTSLSVGTKLVIPAGNQGPAEAKPTPAMLQVRQSHCWTEATGGLWCLALVQNEYAETLENLSAQFALLDASGQELANQVVYGLLDILPPGASMPLAAHFAPSVPGYANVRVQVLSAIRLLPGDTRYPPVSLDNTLVTVDASGRTAEVSGLVVLSGKGSGSTLWVLASAYDEAGNVVGVRRWESPMAVTAGGQATFDFQVSSLGQGIARVEFLVEAQP